MFEHFGESFTREELEDETFLQTLCAIVLCEEETSPEVTDLFYHSKEFKVLHRALYTFNGVSSNAFFQNIYLTKFLDIFENMHSNIKIKLHIEESNNTLMSSVSKNGDPKEITHKHD